MISIEDLKNRIETNSIGEEGYVFYGNSPSARFLMFQYINAISKNLNKDIDFQNTLVKANQLDIFNVSENGIKVYVCQEFTGKFPTNERYYYIIADKIKDVDFQNVVEFPKLEQWQIKDYAYSNLEGVDVKKIDYLCEICNYDIYRIDQEVKRFHVFSKNELPYIFDDFVHDGGYSELSNKNIFDFTNSIIKKDYTNISKLYSKIGALDIEPMGLLVALISNFRDIITIQLSSNPSPETCGMNANKFWAVKKNNCGIWSREELVYRYKFLLSIDKNIKTGNLTTDNSLIDYILVNIL